MADPIDFGLDQRSDAAYSLPRGVRVDDGGALHVRGTGQGPTHPIVVDTGGSIEFLATNTADTAAPLEIAIAVETIPDLIAAVRARSSPITYYKEATPLWLPRWLVWKVLKLLVRSVLFYLVVCEAHSLAHEALSLGCTLELTLRGSKPSVTLWLPHPSAGDAARPPHRDLTSAGRHAVH
jgi:hypothetical protein